jgi:ribosomal protein L7Ae-like RNA K-turn-binding protein
MRKKLNSKTMSLLAFLLITLPFLSTAQANDLLNKQKLNEILKNDAPTEMDGLDQWTLPTLNKDKSTKIVFFETKKSLTRLSDLNNLYRALGLLDDAIKMDLRIRKLANNLLSAKESENKKDFFEIQKNIRVFEDYLNSKIGEKMNNMEDEKVEKAIRNSNLLNEIREKKQ